MLALERKVAIITGGASGIGTQIAKVFAENGASVVIADIDAERGNKVHEALRGEGYNSEFVMCNVTRQEHCKNLVESCLRTFGTIDVVVNCAGVVLTKSTERISLNEWKQIIETNLQGTFLVSKFALPHLKRSKGCIINIASIAGIIGFKGLSAYCASKGGIIAFSRALALELAEYGVRVNCVCPGTVDTPFMTQLIDQSRSRKAARAHFEQKTPLKRPAAPMEIASLVLFLADENQSSYMTGSITTVDGGYTAQ